MNRILLITCLLTIALFTAAQQKKELSTIRVAMTAENWEADSGQVQFLIHKSTPCMRILKGTTHVVLKKLVFGNGTIEYDVEPDDPFASHLFYRRKDKDDNEHFYLRLYRSGNPQAIDAVQYAPIVKGASLWNLYNHFEGPAAFSRGQWNHIKLVVSGAQMIAYVNDMRTPALMVPRQEADVMTGGIAFNGAGYIANLVVKPDAVEGLPPGPGFEPGFNDPRYIRNWQVSPPMSLPPGRELCVNDFPQADSGWLTLKAERYGLVNLSRVYGKSPARRAVWLRVRLKTDAQQVRKVNFGFCQEAWVFVNGAMAFADKNFDGQPISKHPEGTCSIENASFTLPLKAGVNEILIGVANTTFGWGIVARLDSMEGIEIIP